MPKLTMVFAVSAALLWAVAVAGIWLPVEDRLLSDDRAAAVALTILAWMPWMMDRIVRDRVVRKLADRVVASQRAVRAVTGPHRTMTGPHRTMTGPHRAVR